MKISYNWLKEYLPSNDLFDPLVNDIDKVADILTSVGLEVEAVEPFESVLGGLAGLIVGEVVTCTKHPDADKLKITTVNTGRETLQIVCGAPNVAAGQKVIVALAGTTIYPVSGDPVKIKKSKIRGVESNGMLCAEDEIGIGASHDGIMVLPDKAQPGQEVSDILPVYKDFLIEIGLTPNRMDGQSHLGVAKDVCAWLTYHTGRKAEVVSPVGNELVVDDQSMPFRVEVKDSTLAARYSGVTISDIAVEPSPEWMQNKLKVLGLRPVNNVVDITNYILHATGQPLHAFDADKIGKRHVKVEQLAAGTLFTTLDTRERKLSAEDIMICDGDDTPMCIGGVFGGIDSGVTAATKNIFLESAVFNPALIRRSIIRHDLRTDAAMRFEKGVDVSKTVDILKYAASLIRDICKGRISSQISDIFNKPAERLVVLKYAYLKKLSGKDFTAEAVSSILTSLGFKVSKSDDMSITVLVPESNPDIKLPADVVEEILRISGLDNIDIPGRIKMTPGTHDHAGELELSEKISSWLTGNGFSEIFTNSITNENYFDNATRAVHILNSLSEELTVLRMGMLPTGLEAIAYNLNRQNKDLLLFEYGKTYHRQEGKYVEENHLNILCTGEYRSKSWYGTAERVNLFYLKGIARSVFLLTGIAVSERTDENGHISFLHNDKQIANAFEVPDKVLQKFSIKQPVFNLDIDWDRLKKASSKIKSVYRPVSKFPAMVRDLSIILGKDIAYAAIEEVIQSLHLKKLSEMRMFDLYQSDKLGQDRKSVALSFSFVDTQKTLTDKETDKMMQQISPALEKEYNAQIRSHA